MTETSLTELLMRVEQSENARLLDKHTPEFRLFVGLVDRVLALQEKLNNVIEDNDLFQL